MELIDISQNDDLVSVAKKCNMNFKQLWFTIKQSSRKQDRIERSETNDTITDAVSDIINITIPSVVSSLVNVTIPNTVSSQIAAQDIPGQVSTAVNELDVPQMISDEVDQRIVDAYPEVGTYVISDTMPTYDGTTWQQVDTITTDTSVTIPVWQRTA